MSSLKKIKILFIHSTLVCGGAEQALYDLVTLMDRTRFDVTILVQHEGGIWEEKFIDAGIKVVSIWGTQKKTANPVIKLQNLIQRHNIRKALKMDGRGLIDAIFKDKFDVVVSFCVWDHHYIGFQKNAKTVKYIHGDVSTLPEYKASVLEISDILNEFDRIICVSETARQSFIKLTGQKKGVVSYINPLNSENVRRLSRVPLDIQINGPVICAVGRLAVEKGFDRLIRIHDRILKSGIPHTLVIVGDGPEKNNLISTINELGVNDSVFLTGYKANPYPYMANSRFVVCSSFSEGLGVIALESLCLGIPVVSAVPAIGELFGQDVCGVITQNDDISLENGIKKMLSDSIFYLKAKTGAEKRSSLFDGKNMVAEIEHEFIDLLSNDS